ncbi:MauE/DoxX family redox-associated membrane protein [Kribbella catacumbae]|uniref:MauE/DoxX family redox-associated membrane protein n=1 Tax=Kribbella catacumbae TaxID=460086 RepID=UPI000367F986|nr:MauE/DoxX family redox-associated membrane protein [Kribbella catacumbae]
MTAFTSAAAVLLGLVFLTSSSSKLRSRESFRRFRTSVPAFGIPAGYARRVALLVTGAEVAIVVLLALAGLIGSALPGIGAAALLLVPLTVGTVRAVLRDTGATCRCFGGTDRRVSRRHFVRNGLLLLIAIIGLLTALPGGSPSTAGWALAAFAGLIGGVLLIFLDEIIELFS